MKKLLVAGCALMLVYGVLITAGAGAQPAILAASSQFVTFGMVGLATGQTARLNAFALPVGGPIIAGASCQVTFDFYDVTGKSLKASPQPITVPQGTAVSFDLQRSEITSATSAPRVEIRGTVRAAFVSPSAVGTPVTPGMPSTLISGFCSVLPTLEIFDSSTGQTTVVLQQTTALPLVTPL
jgi:hypothetical protein